MPGKTGKVKAGKVDKAFLDEEEQSAFAKANEGKPKGRKTKAKVTKKTAKVRETTDEVKETTPEVGETPIMPLTIEKLRFLRRNTRSYQEAVEVTKAKQNWNWLKKEAVDQDELVDPWTLDELIIMARDFMGSLDVGRLIADPEYCLLYTSPSPRDKRQSRMPSSA